MTRKKANKQTLPGKRRSAMVFEELEPRLLLSADLPIDLPAVLAPDRGDGETVSIYEEITTTVATEEQHAAHELVFVDTDTPDYQTLVDDLLSNSSEDRLIEVVLLDNSRDGIAQITDTLAEHRELDAVHIISHGSEGAIDLGGTQLEFDTLLANTKAIQGWAEAFSENGDLLIYGCNLAASADGQALVDSLARLTGADVAASDDLTGTAEQGGDWELEYTSGQIDASVAASVEMQQAWRGVLADNQAPVNGVPGAQSTPQDTTLEFLTTNGNAITVSDADAGSNEIEVTLSVDNGTLSVNSIVAIGSETTLNTWTTGTQTEPAVAYAADGSYVAVWQDSSGLDGDLAGVYGQRFDTIGNKVGGEFLINTTTASSQFNPSIAMDDAGNFVVAWTHRTNGGSTQIHAQRFDSNAVKQGGDFTVNTQSQGNQFLSDVAMDPSGNFVVAWYGNGGGDDEGVFIQRYDAAGNELGGETLVNTEVIDDQQYPRLAMDDAGNFVVVWQSTLQDGSAQGIYGQRFSATGVAQGGEFLINTTTANAQTGPSVSMDSVGNFVVVWESNLQDGSGTGVYAQRYDSAGNALGGEFLVNETTAGSQRQADVAMTATGDFVVTWASASQDGSDYAVVARRFDASGSPVSGEVIVNTTTSGGQSNPAIDILDNGDFVVAWFGNGPGDDVGVFAQRFASVPLTFSVGDGVDDTTMTFNGTVADINTAMEGMTYTPSGGYNGFATLTITTDDQGNTGTGGPLTDVDTVSITVGNPNAPVIDLNGGDGAGNDFVAGWTEGSGTVVVVDADGTLIDADENLSMVTVAITNLRQPGIEILAADSSGTTLAANYNSGTGVLTISGSGTAAEYQQVLRTVTYNNTSDTPDTTARIITFTATDAISNGNTATTTLTVSAANDAPVNTVPVGQITPQDTDLVFSSGNSNALSVGDADAGSSEIEVTLSVGNGTLSVSGGGIPVGTEFLVNTTVTDTQLRPATAMMEDGSFVMAWSSNNQDGSGYGVFAQRFDADGNKVGGEFQVNTYTSSIQSEVAVAVDDAGNFTIVWKSASQDKVNTDGIYGQRYDANGNALGGEFQVNTYTTGHQTDPDIAMGSSGNFVVVWSGESAADTVGVHAQLFDSSGNAVGAEIDVNSYTTDLQEDPSVAMDDSGNFVVVWRSDNQDGDAAGIYAQRFNASGVAQGIEFRVNETTTSSQYWSDVAMDADGDFVVAWTDSLQGLMARVYNSSGVDQTGEFSTGISGTNGPTVAMDADGNFTVARPEGGEVSARSFDLAGTALGDVFQVNTTSPGIQPEPDIAMNGSGDYIIAWDGTGSGDTSGIFAQRYAATGLTFTTGDGTDDATMTFTGTVADINTALEGLTYTPNGGFNGTDTLTLTTDDQGNTGSGGALSDVDTVNITVGNPNAPVINLDANDSSAAGGNNFVTAWAEGGGAVLIVDSDATLIDGDENLTSVTVTITNLLDGTAESLSANAGATGLAVNYDSGTGVLTISGTGTAAQYQQVMRTITYNNTSQNPDTTTRIINFTATDSLSNGNTATTTLSVTATNDAPVNTAPGSWSTSPDFPIVFSTVNGNAISVSDVDAETVEVTLTATNGTLTVDLGSAAGDETLINSTTTDVQQRPDIAVAADGSYVVVWAGQNQDGDGWGIYAQRFDGAGNAVSGEILVNGTTTGDQINPSVAIDDAGNFVVAWETNHLGSGYYNIFAQRFDASGNAVDSEFQVDAVAGGDVINATVAMDADGDFVIAFENHVAFDGDGWGIYAHRYDSGGVSQGGAFLVNSTTAGNQAAPSVAMDDAGNFVVAWGGPVGANQSILFQRYDSAGNTVGDETIVTNAGFTASVSVNALGEFVVVWQGADTSSWGVYGRQYDATGTAVGAEFQVNTYETDDQTNPDVALADNGEFTVAWYSILQDANPGWGVYGQRYDAAGSAVDGEFLINSTTAGAQYHPAIGVDANGRLAVAWDGNGSGDADGIYVKRYGVPVAFSAGDGIDDATMTFSGSIADVNAVLDGLIFTPTTSYTGSANLQIQTSDLGASGTGGTLVDTDTIDIVVGTGNVSPVITSDGGGATANVDVAENTTAVTTVTATDADPDTLTYSISGGADGALFSIDGSTGELTFISVPDYEAPADDNGDNVYEVTVQVADGNGGFDTQTINVSVTDVSYNLVVTTTAALTDGDVSSAEALNASKGVDNAISLVEAITAANNSAETVTISFNITDPLVGGAHTFTIGAGGLPAISDTVIIDGTTDPDYSGNPVIRLDGSTAGAGVNGLSFAANSDGSVVRGLMITGFSGYGIQVDAGADGITIANNWIGTTGTGSTGVGNSNSGINIQGANTIVGGTGVNDGNVITNNGNEGINVTGAGATGTVIQGNIIGLDPDGVTGSGNADVGIALLSGSHNTTIGGTTVAERNIISNNFEGIEINSNNNIVQGNYIGTDAGGTLDRGNRSDDGVEIQNGATGNLIGGTEAGAGNLVAFNALDGVNLVSGSGNSVLGNQIHSNAGLGIDLGTSGVTANDSGDADSGSNNLQNFPVITAAELNGSDLAVNGLLDTDGLNTQYRLEFYSNAAGAQDVTNGEGRIYLGSTIVTTDGSGNATFTGIVLSGITLTTGDFVTATATRIDTPGMVGIDDRAAYGSSSEFAANVAVSILNNTPTTSGISNVTVDEDAADSVIDLFAVFADAEDADSALTFTITANTNAGLFNSTAIDGAAGTLTLDYAADVSGTADITVRGTDTGGLYVETTFTVTVNAVNDAPVNTVTGSQTVDEETTTAISGISISDVDAGGADLTTRLTVSNGVLNVTLSGSSTISSGSNGTNDLTILGTVTDINATLATLTYTGNTDVVGTAADSLTVTTNDGGNTGTGGAQQVINFVQIDINPVNDAPVAAADSFTVNEGSTTNLNLATNDSDADDGLDLASISIVSGPTNGAIVVNANGTVDYTHDGSETLSDSFTYTIDDLAGATSNTVTVSLTVTPINDAPVAVADSFTVSEGSTTNLNLATNDTDADDGLDLASITIVSGPANGSIVVNANGTVDYTHDGSETVVDSFTYTIDDLAGVTSNTVTVNLAVTPVNDAPVAVADSFTVNEGSTTNLNLAANDTDADDGLDLASIAIVSGPADGSIVVNADGTVDYTHDGSETLSDSFTYTIDDLATATSNTVTVSLTITPVNDAPVAVADSFTVNEGSTTNLNLATNDTDADDGLDLASITIVSGPTNGAIVVNANGTVDYTHDGSETVSDSFTYTIDDLATATSNTVTVSLTVTPVNDAPVATADSFTVNEGSTTNLNLATNDADADDGLDLASITIVSGPTNGSLVVNANGTVDYTHDGSETIVDSFTYTIDDLATATSNTVTVSLTVTPVNDAPVAVADSFTVNEGSTTNLNLATNDTDADDGLDLVSITIVSGPTNGSIVVNANGTVDYTHDGSETVVDSFTYTIDDLAGATSNTVTVNLVITPVNDAPIAVADSFTVNEGSTTNLNLAANDTDADDGLDLASISIVSGPTNGSLVVNANGTVDYTHDGSETVADSFTYTIDDLATATSNTVTVSLTITPVNDAPVAVADSFTVNEGSATNLNLATNDTDADDGLDLASITIVSGATNGSLVVNANGTVDYTHDGSETVADSFTYTIDDVAGATSNTVTVNLTVTPVNDAPIATADSFTVSEGSTTNLNLAANDTDADDGLDLTSITIVSGPTNGSLVVNANGTVDYTHDGSETISDSFTYTIDDLATATSNTVTVSLTITPVNDAPVAVADSFTVNEGSTTNLNLATNDTDSDDGLDLNSITIVSGPTNGSLVVNADGTVDYTHDGSETVVDSFTYTIDDLATATSNTVTVSLTVTPVNNAPVAVADSFTVNEGSTTNLNLATNDTDADDGLDLASITIVSGPTNGSLVVNANGTVDYAHDGSETVADSFTYTIDDLATATSNTVTVSLTITPVNDAPIAVADSFTVNEGSTTNLNLATNDTDADDGLDLTSITIVSGPTNGSIVVNANGTVDYTHDGSETLSDSFTYTIDDLATATSNTVTVSLTVTPVNDAPVAVADSFTVNEGSTTNLNLVANDTDADDGPDLASITIVSGPTNGAIVVNANGTVDYTHDGSETVADSFTYTIDDLATATSNTVTVSLTVTPVNDAPIAVADSFTVNEGSTTNLNLAINDTDADDGLDLTSITIVSGPTNGSIVVNANGTVDYTHDGSETVADSFTYTIDDLAGAASNTVTVSLTVTPVNDAPVAVADSFTVNEGSTTNLNLATNDTDADDGLDLSSITIVSGPTNGSIVVNANGTVDYTHDGSETIVDSFTYTIDDLATATSNTVTVSLTVTPINDAPIAVADSFTVNEGSTTNLNLAANDSDADDGLDLSSITIVSGPTNGSLVVNANGTVDYTHDGSESVSDSFTYTIDDLAGVASNTVTVSLTVTPINDAPVAVADSFTVNEGSTTNLNLATNDTDADDGLDLASISIVSGPTNGSIVVNADGTVDYTHDGSETVADSFTYSIDDLATATSNTVTVNLTVTPVNDAPIAVADSFTVNEGSTTNLNLAANDSDADDGLDLASITIVSGPANGSILVNADGTVDYTHNGSETVADSFTYTIDDLAGATSNTVTVSLTITPVNDAPIAVADSFTVNEGSTTNLNLAINDTDADDGLDLTSITIISGPTNGSIVVNANGTVDYTHDGSETVADSFTYTIDDLATATSNTVTVSLTVTPVNDAPVAVADSFTVSEGSTTNLNLATNDSDADDGLDLASITIVSGPTNGSIVVNANGTVDYTHDGSETVADSFTYTIDDLAGAASNTVTVSLTVTPVNDAPIAVADSFTVNEGSTTNLNLAANDSDADDGLDLNSITIVSGPTNGSLVVNANGTVDYTHDGSATVADSFTYTIDDLATATSNTVTVSLTVTPVNDAPVAVADSFTVNEGSTTNLNLATNDTDADDGLDLASITIVSGPTNGSIVVNANGTVDYTHDGSETVSDSFTYTIDDLATATSNTVTVSLTITPVNTAPVAVADSFTVNEGSTTNLNLATNDTDVDDGLDLASITIVSGPTNGSIVVNANGTVDYTHDGSETVSDSFTYTIDDLATATSNTATVNLTVTPVNDAPVAVADSFTVNEGSTTNLNLATNDSDADDGLDLASITIVSGPTNGSLVVNANGTVDYTHDGSESVSDSFTYTIDDLAGVASNTVTVSLTVTPINDAPVAVADSFTVNEGSTTNLNLATNDTDADDGLDLASISIVSGPTNGSIVVNADGTVDYTHDGSETVADSFTYSIDDLATATSNTVTVNLTVTPVNDAPIAVADSFTVNEGSTTNLNLAANDSDADDGLDLASITIVSGPANGSILVNADGTVDYTHNGSETVADSFTYTIDDLAGATSNTVTVNLTVTPVNDAPVAVADSFTVNEGSTTNLNLATNDTDADDGLDLTSITIVSGPTNGSVVFNADGTVDYTHNGSETIADSFTYTINDASGATSAVGTVNLTIDPVNDAPIHSVPGAQSTPSTTPLIFSSLNGNGITVADPDASGAPVEVTLSVSNGTLSLAGTTGLSFNVGDGSSDATMTFTGTAADINAALNGLSFQADEGYEGMATAQIITDDLGNVGTGGALNALDRVNITVTASAPTATAQDTLLTLDELILEDMLDLPAPELKPVNRANVAPAAEEAAQAVTPASVSQSATTTTPDSAVDALLGSGRATQADVSLPGVVELFGQNLQPHDDDRPSSVRLIGHVIRQGLVDPFTYAKMLNPLQPDMAIWESIEAMMEQMDGRDTSWYSDDQVLTTTTATGLTVSFTVGYVSWLLRAGYLSASLMSVLPLWREFDPLPVLAATTRKKKGKPADDGKDSPQTNDIESESIFSSNETV